MRSATDVSPDCGVSSSQQGVAAVPVIRLSVAVGMESSSVREYFRGPTQSLAMLTISQELSEFRVGSGLQPRGVLQWRCFKQALLNFKWVVRCRG